MNFYLDNLNDLSIFILSIFIGLITYSIPFIINAYEIILRKKENIRKEQIEAILIKEEFRKSIKLFERLIQYPTGIIIFLGLFFMPFMLNVLSLKYVLIILILFFLYFLFLPQIFEYIESKSSTDLLKFLSQTDGKSKDVIILFREIWKHKDEEIQEKFSIPIKIIFESFSRIMDSLTEENCFYLIRDYFFDFYKFIDNRTDFFFLEDYFKKILNWHTLIWKKMIELMPQENTENTIEKDKSRDDRWIYIHESYSWLNSILLKIENRSLKEGKAYSFFRIFKDHVKENETLYSKLENDKERFYIEELMNIFYQEFFNVIIESPKGYEIRGHHFPNEWKITLNNLKNNKISIITFKKFLKYAEQRIWQANEKWDKNLDEILLILFPEVDKEAWAIILIFVLSPPFTENKITSTIEHLWNFGYLNIKPHPNGLHNAFDLANFLFSDLFSKEKLKEYIKEIEKLGIYKIDGEKEYKKLKLLDLFKKMLEYFENKNN
jgi:hypothetical protein